jgi:WD40 repeat protein
MTTGIPAGTSMKCPACGAKFKVPAGGNDDEDDRDEIDEDEAPRRRKSKKGRNDRRRTKAAGPPLGLWLGIGGAVLAVVVVVLVIVLGRKKPGDQTVDKPGEPAPAAKEGGGTDAYTVTRRIDTNIPLPRQEPFILTRGILLLAPSADASVIAVTSGASPRRYTINRQTGQVIAQFDEPDAKDPAEVGSMRDFYHGYPTISPDGKLVVVKFGIGLGEKTIKVRDVATGNVVKTLGDAKIQHFHRFAFSPKGDILYALIIEPFVGNVLVGWSTANWQEVCRIKMPENKEPTWIVPLADGKTVVTLSRAFGERKAQADYFDVREQKFVRAFTLASWKETRTLAISPDGKLLAVVGDNGRFNQALEVYNTETFKHISTIAESKDITQPGGPPDDSFPQVFDLRFLPDGRIGVVGGHPTTGSFVATYDAKTGTQKAIWKHDEHIGGRKMVHLSFCANGELLVNLDGDTATLLFVRLKE